MVSKDLQKRGFKYLGWITVYEHLQVCGMVNDHLEEYLRYRRVMEGSAVVRRGRMYNRIKEMILLSKFYYDIFKQLSVF